MKRSITLLLLSVALFAIQSKTFATIRRVNFTQSATPVNGIDYNTFQLAHDASVIGDTIQIYPPTGGGSANITGIVSKRLVILGPGYFYNSYTTYADIPNASLQLIPGGIPNYHAYNFTISFGSAGTIFQGINGITLGTSTVSDSLNSITVSRCYNANFNFNNNGVCNNWLISQCFGVQVNQGGYDATFTSNRTVTNLRIENCINPIINYSATGGQSPVGVNSGQILNCNYVGFTSRDIDLNNSVFVIQNCVDAAGILGNHLGTGNSVSGNSNTIFLNNLTISGSNTYVATNPGSANNYFNLATGSNSVFVGFPSNVNGSTILYSSDAKWQLATNSVAKNAGVIPGTSTATDCGMYGGTNPYKASGIPAVPAFYKLSAPSSTATTSPYTITFSARSNN